MAYCKQHIRIIGNLIENVHNPHLMEILYKLVDTNLTHQRLLETQLFYNLVKNLKKGESEEVSGLFYIYFLKYNINYYGIVSRSCYRSFNECFNSLSTLGKFSFSYRYS